MRRLSHRQRFLSAIPFLYVWVARNWSSTSPEIAENKAVGAICFLAFLPCLALASLAADLLGADFLLSPFFLLPACLPVWWLIQHYLVGKKIGTRFEAGMDELDPVEIYWLSFYAALLGALSLASLFGAVAVSRSHRTPPLKARTYANGVVEVQDRRVKP